MSPCDRARGTGAVTSPGLPRKEFDSVDRVQALDWFRVTAARTRAFNAFSSIFSPSWKSMARLVFPSKLARADDAVVLPHRNPSPLPLLDDLGIGCLDQDTEPAEHRAPPVAEHLFLGPEALTSDEWGVFPALPNLLDPQSIGSGFPGRLSPVVPRTTRSSPESSRGTSSQSCDSMGRVTISVGLQAALDRTGGTVTSFLEQLVGERIEAHARRHATTGARSADELLLDDGRPLLHRAATLRGRTSHCSYVYAESVINTSRLPPGFSDRLESGSDPIGRILDEMGIAVTRENLVEPDGPPISPPRSPMLADDYLLTRSYRIDFERIPVMIITEWFLVTLMPFLPLAAEPGRDPMRN